jgi:uncharacterized protein (TIGR02996 family)
LTNFEQILEEDPGNQACRLAYADWCEERGRERYARALRWLAQHDKHPVFDDDPPAPVWFFAGRENGWYGECRYDSCKLPNLIHAALVEAIGRDMDHAEEEDWVSLSRGVTSPFSHFAWLAFQNAEQATEYLGRALEKVGAPLNA